MSAPAVTAAATVREALDAAVEALARAGVPEPHADAEVLLAHALATDRAGLVLRARAPMPAAAAARLAPLLARRLAREPVAYVLGEREFWSLPFAVDRRVLVPRPETETLVETALAVGADARRVLDVGTGSGVLAAVLARELPDATVVALDRSVDALAVARANAGRHAPRVRLLAGDLVAALAAGTFDLVVANPPYVAADALDGLMPEVRDHEPRMALDGGPAGLAVPSRLLAEAPRVLLAGGWLVMEVGAGQAEALRRAAAAGGCWGETRVVRDLAGHERVLAVRRGRTG